MSARERLLTRLDAIAVALAGREGGLALLALGSGGLDTERIDEFSDLDFFAIVAEGHKHRFLDDPGWLAGAAEIAYSYRNTPDGFKVLFADGIFAEFAIFEPQELAAIPYAEGRIVWKAPGVDDTLRVPVRGPRPPSLPDVEWCLGEAMTCLYVGLGRFLRGERLSAHDLVQRAAVDRLVELAALVESVQDHKPDPYSATRRFESRFPLVASHLGGFMQGYERTPESALAILEFIEEQFRPNAALVSRIRELIERALESARDT